MNLSTGSGTDAQAGSISVNVGSSTSGPGSNIHLQAGSTSDDNEQGGNTFIQAGAGIGGGEVQITGGADLSSDNTDNTIGGAVHVSGGSSSLGDGGTVIVSAGSSLEGIGAPSRYRLVFPTLFPLALYQWRLLTVALMARLLVAAFTSRLAKATVNPLPVDLCTSNRASRFLDQADPSPFEPNPVQSEMVGAWTSLLEYQRIVFQGRLYDNIRERRHQ